MSTTHETSGGVSHTDTVTFGRTLVDGDPVDEGLTFPVDSPTVERLATASFPLFSNPQLGEYGAVLMGAEETGGTYARGLLLTPPGATGPAEHFHANYAETFEVVEGSLVLELDGEPRTLHAGESVTIEAGIPHTFRNESDAYTSCVVESRPGGRLEEVVMLLFGLAHDGKLPASGRPSFLQAMVMAEEMGDDTVFTTPPPAVQKGLATVFGPIGRLLGYSAMHPEYVSEAFWNARVEQLPAR